MPLLPAAGLLKDRGCVIAGVVEETEQEAAVGLGVVGLELESVAIAGDGRVELPLVLESVAEVVVSHHEIGP
jgi:hypothetical protein